ncbi:type I polyketide synthase [Pseudomonas sp. NPDC087598]|uniref:type I polyketide synthase n=1 Tax=Pseudomonas sp. NPDC087598 TaxID=3364440 RepID=UPI00381A185B
MAQDKVAIIGIFGRFPGAENIDQLWEMLTEGKSGTQRFLLEELEQQGLPASLINDEQYVPVRGVIGSEEYFDSAFFGFSGLEADLMDPQARQALECSYGALEDAGYAEPAYREKTSVFASVSRSEYEHFLLGELDPQVLAAPYTLDGTLADFVPLRIANKLGLEGQSVLVKSACSSSLLAVHMACQHVRNGESSMALVCSSAISWPARQGRLAVSGGVMSIDGKCRPFDAQANGTVSSDAVVAIVLKPLDKAIEDNDRIYAVIAASAANNDGGRKSSFTAPSVDGQKDVACTALEMAGVSPDEIRYIETHGSATVIGDPIELSALAEAYTATDEKIAIGSIKSNIGHTDTSAGLMGLVKVTLCLYHKELVPSINYQTPNPLIDFSETPFVVNTQRQPWRTKYKAAVHATGMGGTNVHCILEAADAPLQPMPAATGPELIVLAAKSPAALENITERLVAFLRSPLKSSLADIANTLQVGRQAFEYRRRIVAESTDDLLTKLVQREVPGVKSFDAGERRDKVVFLCPGLGVNDFSLAVRLCGKSDIFRKSLEDSFRIVNSELETDLMQVLCSIGQPETTQSLGWSDSQSVNSMLDVTYAHPLIFCIQLGFADLWASVGIKPSCLVGYSLGEYVAATLAGVFSREDALRLVAKRAGLIDKQSKGRMVAVALPYEQLLGYCNENVSIAAENATNLCVIAGCESAINDVLGKLKEDRVFYNVIQSQHAFHTQWMSPASGALESIVGMYDRQAPEVPFISNVTGDWITDDQVNSTGYWADHLSSPVQYLESLKTLAREQNTVYVELGAAGYLADLAKLINPENAVNCLTSFDKTIQADVYGQWLAALGTLWGAGVEVNWPGLERRDKPRRVSLPTYPYSRKRHAISPSGASNRDSFRAPAAQVRSEKSSLETVGSLPVGKDAGSSAVYDIILKIWQRAFGNNNLSGRSHFYEMGGHSLLAVQLLYYIRESLQVSLNVGDLRAHPTIDELSQFVAKSIHMQRNDLVIKGAVAKAIVDACKEDRADLTREYVLSVLRRLSDEIASVDTAKIKGYDALIADLTRVLKHDLGRPVYAHELTGRDTLASLCELVNSVVFSESIALAGAGTAASETTRSAVPAVLSSASEHLIRGKNPQAAFILSSARSGSTLLRVMLAGHPQLFCPPELHLLGYPTVKARNEHLQSEHFGKGLQRALMELYHIGPSEADEKVKELVANNSSISQAFALMQTQAAPRLLVDKSPDYAGDPDILRSALDMFESSRFVVLTRHPGAVMESYVRNRIGAIATNRWADPFAQAEDHWFRYYSNIMNFVSSLPDSHIILRYEDLVENAEVAMRRTCEFLGVAFHPAVLDPYSGARMIDGAGDPNFHEHQAIEKTFASRWKDQPQHYQFSSKTIALAKTMGYEI